MLTKGNSKLGSRIWSFSIPALHTCPGATPLCSSICYALRGRFKTSWVLDKQKRNLERTRKRTFVPRMLQELAKRRVRILRIHCAGDFFSKRYIKKWLQIARASPHVTIYAYTRSYRVPGLLPLLRELGREPNVRLWFSADRDTGRPPRARRVRVAYLSVDDTDQPDFPVDLVFREKEATPMRFTPGGSLVCPYEQAIPRQTKVTCSRCQYCFTAPRTFETGRRLSLTLV